MATTTTDQPQSVHQQGDGEVVSATRARQGFKMRPILYVLLASLFLVVVAFAVAFVTNDNQDAAQAGGYSRTTDPATSEQFNTPEPAPKVVPST